MVYLPVDRLQALAQHASLPERDQGAALFADISGFTRLTDALQRALGPRRGAETLARQLDLVYDALIAEVNRYGGSVIGFSGDAVTCWFSDLGPQRFDPGAAPSQPAALRAVTCALAMLAGLQRVERVDVPGVEPTPLALKVSIAGGDVRRFVVGDPAIQRVDVVVGQTLQIMSAGESLAGRGEVIVDSSTASRLGQALQTGEQRHHAAFEEPFWLVRGLAEAARPHPWPALAPGQFTAGEARPWLLPAIYNRLNAGLGEFLTELRPAVALFQHFSGIDYDLDPQAGEKLDAYLRWVQSVLARYDGSMIQLTIGEKGSFIYAAFGAPNAHENDPWRAVSAALELRSPPVLSGAPGQALHVHIGLSMGVMRTGTYGSKTRRTYGVLGDNVNLAARLMQASSMVGEILASQNLSRAASGMVGEKFDWQDLPPMLLKGKPEPTAVARLLGRLQDSLEISYSTPLVGRQDELDQIAAFVAPVFNDEAQGGRFAGVINIYGETGVGKSRLVHAFRQRMAGALTPQRFQWFECPAEQTLQESLYPFVHFLRRYFEQEDGAASQANQARFDQALNSLLERLRSPEGVFVRRELLRTRSMLAALIGLPVEGTLFEKLEPKLRFENTLVALRSLILAESLQRPLLLHIEDAHWLDGDSLKLLDLLSRGVAAFPFAILLTSRCTDTGECIGLNLEARVPQATVYLGGLKNEALRDLAQAVLAQDEQPADEQPQPVNTAQLGGELAAYLEEKTSGNPLFLEQLVRHLKANRLLQQRDHAWVMTQSGLDEVPASINAVLLAWLDRLENRLAAGIQTASVLGGEFELPLLQQMIPAEDDLQSLVEMAVVNQIWAQTSEKRLLFRQSLLRDVAYEMQPLERLQHLHAQAVAAIEAVHQHDLGPQYAALAYHAGQAQEHRLALDYARRAAEFAAERFANQQAIQHYLQALQSAAALDPQETLAERQALRAALGELLLNTSQHQAALLHLNQAFDLAVELGDAARQARVCRWLARLCEQRGDYPQALSWIERGLLLLDKQESDETTELFNARGLIYSRQGDMAAAMQNCQAALRIAEKTAQTTTLARTYNLLGHIARIQGDSLSAIKHFERALALYQQAGDLSGQATTHNQVANALFGLGRWGEAGTHFSKARQLFDQVGDGYHRAFIDNNLGWIAVNQGRLEEAREYYLNGLRTVEETGASAYVMGSFHNNLGATYIRLGDAGMARQCLQTSQAYFQQAGARDWLPEMHRHLADLALLEGDPATAQAQAEQALRLAEEMNLRGEQASALRILGEIALSQERLQEAEARLRQSLDLLNQGGDPYESARAQLALAGVYHSQSRLVEMRLLLERCIPVFERLEAAPDLTLARWLGEN
jgi:class 3 adenylate cyclase/tetratricopeptide (TPR) repeat protein